MTHALKAPLLGLVMAPLLAGLGAVIAGLPVAMAGGLLSWLAHPPHPMSAALERYEAATVGIRICDVCRLARGDSTPKSGVSFCGRCDACLIRRKGFAEAGLEDPVPYQDQG